jgi:hypothetical protein
MPLILRSLPEAPRILIPEEGAAEVLSKTGPREGPAGGSGNFDPGRGGCRSALENWGPGMALPVTPGILIQEEGGAEVLSKTGAREWPCRWHREFCYRREGLPKSTSKKLGPGEPLPVAPRI